LSTRCAASEETGGNGLRCAALRLNFLAMAVPFLGCASTFWVDSIPTGRYCCHQPESAAMHASARHSAKAKILDAAVSVIRAKGYAATTVDDLCAAAGVTKGAFFHHFKSKEDLAIAAAAYWSERARELFGAAPYHDHADPLARFLGYIDFRKSLL